MASFAHSLPSDLDITVVRKEGANQTHRDFRVCLAIHNQYYHALGVTIDTTSLEQLPQDGNISHLLTVTNDCSSPSTVTEPPASDTATIGGIPAVEDNHLPQSFVPFAAPTMTGQEVVHQSVEQHQSCSSSNVALIWPSIGGMPLNEFTTEGYFTCAFPPSSPLEMLTSWASPCHYR